MEILFRNVGDYCDVKIKKHGDIVLDLGLLSVDEALVAHAEIQAIADRIAIWIEGNGVKPRIGNKE